MRLPASIFLLSASALAYEIIVIRILALTHWRPLVTLAVSTALLGFGLAGSLLMWSGGKAFRYRHVVYPLASTLAALSFRPSAWAAAALHMEPGLIFRDPSQWALLSGLVAVLTVPFLLVSICLALPLLEKSTGGKYYGWNLSGACGGVALALAAMATLPPEHLARVPSGTAALGALLAIHYYRSPKTLFWAAVAGFTVALSLPSGAFRYGPYKDISYSLRLPEASVLARSWGAGGLLEIVDAPALRTAPGLSTRYEGLLPRQAVLYRDGDRAGTLILNSENAAPPEHLAWQTATAPYSLFHNVGKIVVLGFDGGEEVARASLKGAGRCEVVEADNAVAALLGKMGGLSGGGGWLPVGSEVHVQHPRHYLSVSEHDADIVVVPLMENMSSSVAGFSAASESFLLTSEGIKSALNILKPGGVLAITGWNQVPPVGQLKLIKTLAELDGYSVPSEIAGKVRLVAGWSTYTLVIGRQELREECLNRLRGFCLKCGFVLLEPGQLARTSGSSLLNAVNGKATGLDLGPVTDEKPYPWHTLGARLMIRAMGSGREEILPRMEWGLLFLVMTLFVTLAVSAIVLYLTRPSGVRTAVFPPLLYFTCIGFGYMAVEILAIKRGGLLIAQPVTATALVLAPFLLFSGLGSFAVENVARGLLRGRWVFPAVAGGAAFLYIVIPGLVPLPDPGRTILFAVLVCPLALLMGLPFPLGLRCLNSGRETSVPWVWAVSGYSSASGSALAGVLAVLGGHAVLLAVAAFFYLSAGALLGKFPAR